MLCKNFRKKNDNKSMLTDHKIIYLKYVCPNEEPPLHFYTILGAFLVFMKKE